MKNKRIDHISKIMSKRHGVFTKHITIFFFTMQEKLETCWNSNLINTRRTSFEEDINLTFISYDPVPWILNNFIYFRNFIQ